MPDTDHPLHDMAERPALLIHITDPHLLAEPQAVMLGVNTEACLQAVLRQAMHEHPGADLLLATGDLAQDGSRAAYQRLRGWLGGTGLPIRCLPGNHDDAGGLRDELGPWLAPVTDLAHWRVVMLDSTLPDANAGHLDDAQLQRLEQALAEAGERHILVALHHNPVQTDSDWHDGMMLDNPQALFQRLGRCAQVRVLLWGHIHRPFDRRWHHLRMLATPSTGFQFAIRDGRNVLDDAAPGYRWLKLYPDGTLATGVQRLSPAVWASLRAKAGIQADAA